MLHLLLLREIDHFTYRIELEMGFVQVCARVLLVELGDCLFLDTSQGCSQLRVATSSCSLSSSTHTTLLIERFRDIQYHGYPRLFDYAKDTRVEILLFSA